MGSRSPIISLHSAPLRSLLWATLRFTTGWITQGKSVEMCFSRPWVSSTSNTWLERDELAGFGQSQFLTARAARNEIDLVREPAHHYAGDQTHRPTRDGVCFLS
jgi:hypothetical protein